MHNHWRNSITKFLIIGRATQTIIRSTTVFFVINTRKRRNYSGCYLLAFLVLAYFTNVIYGPIGSLAAAPLVDIDSAVVATPTTILPTKPKRTFRAVITQYSRADSCHTVKNGKCIMASGRAVYAGAAACPDFLNLGTMVNIDGQSYTCEDRYAKWLDRKRGLPTVDIFVEKNPYGNSVKLVTIES